ncbi:hypothetical protein BASA81_002132 [Batrachochytrium salamandrivorans]|nr:hypothetical protein BASA81_002132 [Batrachochytrium salamandrivorans]
MSALKTLAHRLGVRELDPELAVQLEELNLESFSQLAVSPEWAVRAAALSLAAAKFDSAMTDDQVVLRAVLMNLDHENNRTRLETLPLIGLIAKRSPMLAWEALCLPLLGVAQSTIQLDEEARGVEAELQGYRETKQSMLMDLDLCEVYKDMAWEIDLYRTKRFSVLGRQDQNLDEQSHGASTRSSRLSSSGWSARRRLDSGQVALMVHETVGWKGLETSLRGLSELAKFQSANVLPVLFPIAKQALGHSNRFVRVAGFELLQSLLLPTVGFPNAIVWLQRGMCDSNNEVRLRACWACQTFLSSPRCDSDRLALGPVLCLNRHYSQVGIRDPSTAAWKLVGLDKTQVQLHLPKFVDFFLQQASSSKDEFAREAACVALGEMVGRVMDASDGETLETISLGVQARLLDSSWSVQAAACQTVSQFPSAFARSKALTNALLECASDLIWSVRDEAAMALASNNSEDVRQACRDMMLRRPAPHHHHHHSSSPSTENQIMFACCSSEINDKKQLHKHDYQFVDGGLRLFRELMLHSTKDLEMDEPLVDDFLLLVDQNSRHEVVEETIWKLIIPLANKMGKKPFKRKMLDYILPSLIRALEHPSFSPAYAASLTCQFLKEWIGAGVLQARVEAISPALWTVVERNPPQAFDSPVVSFRS